MKEQKFAGHVIACLFVDSDTPTLGLVNFVMPLRSIFLAKSELKPVVFIGNLDYFTREWPMLQNFPQIYILPVRLNYFNSSETPVEEYALEFS